MAKVHLVPNVSDPEIVERQRYFRCIVGGTVVHNQNFKVTIGLCENRIYALWQELCELVARDYERDAWIDNF